MSKGKIAVFLLTVLVLLSAMACAGYTSQGPQEQQRPAENQTPAQEDTEEPALKTPEKSMEETANEEQTK